MDIQLEIIFDSDFMVGTGYGIPGVLDNTTWKTKEKIPVIPGSTLKGNIRESCVEISKMLELPLPEPAIPQNDALSPLARVFGTPCLPSLFCFGTAFVRNAAFNPFFPQVHLKEERHNRIDAATGTTMDDHFFSYECVSRALQYSADISLNPQSPTPLTDNDLAFLIAGIRFTRQLGAKKTRGRGKCLLVLQTPENWKSLLENWLGKQNQKRSAA